MYFTNRESSCFVSTRLHFRHPLGSGRVRSLRARVVWVRTHFPPENQSNLVFRWTNPLAIYHAHNFGNFIYVSHLVRDPVVAGFNTCSSKYWRTNRTRSSRDGRPNSTISSNLSLIAQSNWSGWLLARTSINLQAKTEKHQDTNYEEANQYHTISRLDISKWRLNKYTTIASLKKLFFLQKWTAVSTNSINNRKMNITGLSSRINGVNYEGLHRFSECGRWPY